MLPGAIILCGGRSSRMGLPKLSLPFGPELMLPRVVRLVRAGLGSAAGPIVVVAAPEQELPTLPDDVRIVRDRREGRGPLEGIAAGLSAVGDAADAVYATSCDVPLLVPEFIQTMFARLGAHDIAVPRDGRFHHPLAAVYRTSVAGHVERLLAADRLRPFFLFEEADTLEVPVDELRAADPELTSLLNLNRPEDYLAALAQAGFSVPPEIVAQLTKPE